MKTKKVLSVLCLWLALLALVCLYSDKDAYTWRFSGDSLDSLLQTDEAAAAAEEAYAAMMRREQAAAAKRTRAGLWGAEETENKYSDTLPAVTRDGLNLMWGTYDVRIEYDSPEPFTVRMASPGRSRFIRGGDAVLGAGEKRTETFRFELTDSTEHLRLAGSLPEGAKVRSAVVRRDGQRLFSPDLLAYALLCGIVLTVLLVLQWDQSAQGPVRRRDALILVGTVLFASMPLLWDGLQSGHDLIFHLNRIEGIASGLRSGQFPVRIHPSTLQGYGYAAPLFYPELFLYIPALMRNLGVSLFDSLRVFEMTINLLTALTCYLCAHRLTGSRKTALGASVLYTLAIYRLVNLYVRATLGESLAMIFFPLLVLAMTEVLERDARRWPLLALAMTGIFMSHLLSTLFAAAFCLLAALLSLPRLLREPRRLLAILAAAGVTVLASAWFWLPMLDALREDISTSVVLNASRHVLKLGSYLVIFSGNNGTIPQEREDFAYTIGVVPGLALMAGCALYLTRCYIRNPAGRLTDEQRRLKALNRRLLLLGGIALLCATDFFPWRYAVSISKPYSTFFMQLQFPWRLVGIALPMLSIVAACGYLGGQGSARSGLAALCILSVLTGGYTMQCFSQDEPVLSRTGYVDSRIIQFEYTYVGTEKEALAPGEILLTGAEDIEISDYRKNGCDLSFTVLLPDGGKYIDLPLLYYPGYHAEMDGVGEVRVRRGGNNRIRLYEVEGGVPTRVHVWFETPLRWRIAEAAGGAGCVLLAALLLWMRRRCGRADAKTESGALA